MRTLSFSLLLCLIAACGASRLVPAPLPKDQVSAEAAGTVTKLVIVRAGHQFELAVPRDQTVKPGADVWRVDVLVWTDTAVVVVDTYLSAPLGLSMCQAGEERFLRVVSLAASHAELAFSIKLESCRDSIELAADAPPRWNPDSRTLEGQWMMPHPELHTRDLKLRFDANGALSQ